MDRLIAGYRRFRAGTWRTEGGRLEELSRLGQRPRALVIACSDSRADPYMVFDAAPGDLFVIRNIANLVLPYRPHGDADGCGAAIEYAVRMLRVPDVVVMGHAGCGGVKALIERTPAEVSDFVGAWVAMAEPARQRALRAPPQDRHHVCEQEVVRLSMNNLLTFPWIKSAVASGMLTLHGCYFVIQSGSLERLGDDGAFHPIDDPAPSS